MEHFSHKHPLSLLRVREQQQKEKYQGRKLICDGCHQPISSGDLAYFCTQDDCEDIFCLHKPCAELPTEILHPYHREHTFILHKTPVYSPTHGPCWWCGGDLDGFTYNCSLCQINVDIRCIMKDHTLLSTVMDRYLNHKGHAHRLILKPRPAFFFCTACGTEGIDQSYSCTNAICSFWIHRTCALLPETMESKHHNHPLSLSYSFPSAYQYYGFDCGICHREHSSAHWVYHCTRCRYFVHLRCAIARFEEDKSKQPHEDCSIKLPGCDILQVSNIFVELTRNFLEKYGLAQQLLEEINHFSHEHPLTLSIGHESDAKEIRNEEALICDGCILPICDSYYSCERCNYFLHTSCSQFPEQFQHPCHLEHPLVLGKLQRSFSCLECKFCQLQCNGFLYICKVCQFRLDLKCTILDIVSVIMHEAHPHHLVHRKHTSEFLRCNSCSQVLLGPSFGCDYCKFYLDYNCVLLPRYITHFDSFRVYKRDSHPLTLMYPPFSDHPDEFYCEICEWEIHPVNYCLYHCSECDRSFHGKCFVELGKYRNIKFGSTLEVLYHTHALKFIIRGGFTPFCASCDGDLYCEMAFACKDCDYYLCYSCGVNSQYSGSSILKSSVDNIEMNVAEDSSSVLDDEGQAQDSINLPMISDISLELTTHFLKQHGITGSELSAEIKHFSHEHPLNLSANHLEDEEILICDGCIRPISEPYYCCKECDYFLHTYCAQLPEELQNPLHYPHSLVLLKLRGDESCCFCFSSCKGLSFTCKEKCTFQLDIPCAILTASNFIKHEAHSHQLLPTDASWGFWPCSGCRIIIYSSRSLSCVDCSFHLHVECALLPRFARHIKDKHPLVLTSHSFSHQVKVIQCRSCKQNIRTIGWFYYCSQCNQSFHTKCVPAVGLRNAKYGGILRILDLDHPHALKFVRKHALRFCCGYCGGLWFEDEAFECEPCGYRICTGCAQKSIAKRIVGKCPRESEAVGPSWRRSKDPEFRRAQLK